MNEYYQLEPEVAGELGEMTVMDRSVHPPKVDELEIVIKGWLGDCILETFPVFLITSHALEKLNELGGTGFLAKDVVVKKDAQFHELNPKVNLPSFKWLEVNGGYGVHDICLVDHSIAVRQKVLDVFRNEGLNHCDISKIK